MLVKLGASYSTRNNAGISSLDLVGGDTKLIALFGEAVAVSTGAKVSRKSRSPKIGGSGSETDKEVEHVDQNEEQKFEWHGKKPWSEAKDVPVTRLCFDMSNFMKACKFSWSFDPAMMIARRWERGHSRSAHKLLKFSLLAISKLF